MTVQAYASLAAITGGTTVLGCLVGHALEFGVTVATARKKVKTSFMPSGAALGRCALHGALGGLVALLLVYLTPYEVFVLQPDTTGAGCDAPTTPQACKVCNAVPDDKYVLVGTTKKC